MQVAQPFGPIGDQPANIGDQPANIGDQPANTGDQPANIGDQLPANSMFRFYKPPSDWKPWGK